RAVHRGDLPITRSGGGTMPAAMSRFRLRTLILRCSQSQRRSKHRSARATGCCPPGACDGRVREHTAPTFPGATARYGPGAFGFVATPTRLLSAPSEAVLSGDGPAQLLQTVLCRCGRGIIATAHGVEERVALDVRPDLGRDDNLDSHRALLHDRRD